MFISKRKHERELERLRLDAAINDARLISMALRMQKAERVAQACQQANQARECPVSGR